MPNKLRVLLVGVAIEGGGAERVIVDLAQGFVGEGHQVLIAFSEGTTTIVPSLTAQGIECIRLLDRETFASSKLADFTPSLVWKIARLIRKFRPHIIHSHIPRPTWWTAWARTLAVYRCPLIYTEHSIQRIYTTITRIVYRLFLPFVDYVVCVSRAVQQSFCHHWPAFLHRHQVIYNGIHLDRVRPQTPADQVRASLGADADTPVVLNVANLTPQKAQEVLIEAICILKNRIPAIQCWIAGRPDIAPPTAAALQELIAHKKLEDCVHLLGGRSDVPDLLAACDVFALSSRQEGLPITILEAMAAGKPVVATDVGGCAELVLDGHTGLIVPPENPPALADAIDQLLSNPDKARQMGQAGRSRVEQHFSVEKMVTEHLNLYSRLLTDGR